MRSSFNQLLAALASFDLLYLFTMLLEGVSISFSFRYFERMFKMLLNENVLSCKRNMWILFSCIFFVCHHYFTCRPWSVSNLLKLSCWDDDMGDMGVSNRRSLGFVQIWQERGEEGKGRANSKAGQGRICRRRTIGQNQFPQSATRALSQNISICLFALSSWHQQGSYHETAKPK